MVVSPSSAAALPVRLSDACRAETLQRTPTVWFSSHRSSGCRAEDDAQGAGLGHVPPLGERCPGMVPALCRCHCRAVICHRGSPTCFVTRERAAVLPSPPLVCPTTALLQTKPCRPSTWHVRHPTSPATSASQASSSQSSVSARTRWGLDLQPGSYASTQGSAPPPRPGDPGRLQLLAGPVWPFGALESP